MNRPQKFRRFPAAISSVFAVLISLSDLVLMSFRICGSVDTINMQTAVCFLSYSTQIPKRMIPNNEHILDRIQFRKQILETLGFHSGRAAKHLGQPVSRRTARQIMDSQMDLSPSKGDGPLQGKKDVPRCGQ